MNRLIDAVAVRRDAGSRRVLLAVGFLGLACLPAQANSAKLQSEGIASFYGRPEHGGPTASGERFNMHAMTAAHRTAPLGSHLKVTNLKNGKSVVVRINDRGPFIKGRIIDLSHGAADVLGFTGAGLTRVAIETTDAGTQAGSIKVASLDVATTGSVSRGQRTVNETGKPVLSEADRLMIDRSSTNDH